MFGGKIIDGQFNKTVGGLSPDTWYEFKIYAKNIYGIRGYNITSGNTTMAKLGRMFFYLFSVST